METGAWFYYLKFNKYVVLSNVKRKRERERKQREAHSNLSGRIVKWLRT